MLSRADRRLADEFREVLVSTGDGLTSQGSSRVRFGDTEVIVCVNGPKECRFREIDTGKCQVRIKTYPEMHEMNDIIATSIRSTLDLEAYPDSTIEVSVTIVCDDGALLCCAINAAMKAIEDAGLKRTRDIAASCFVIRNRELLVDPSKQEEETADGVATFVWAKDSGEIFSCYFDGLIEPELMVALMEHARAYPENM